MAENFLEEQLKRIREMSDQMSRARNRAAELSAELERDRALIRLSPLHEVRDFRRYSSAEMRESAADSGGRRPSRPSSRRRK
jgi:hypothetical protein